MDLVRIIETECIASCFQFHYGNKSHLNLIDQNGELEPDKTHLLLFPVRRGQFDKNTNSRVYNGNFFFVRPDEFAQNYYNETDADNCESKYESKIEPLITALNSFELKMQSCYDLDIVSWESVDAVDVIDANMSGLWVTFQIRSYE